MTDRHPMDDVPMPVCDTVSAAMSGRGVEYIDGYEIGFQCALDQLRAERIAAYELGRKAVLEDFAEAFEQEAQKTSDHITKSFLMGLANRIRTTLKR